MAMVSGIGSIADVLGSTSAVAITAGSISLVSGFAVFALLLAKPRQPVTERRSPWRGPLGAGAAFLLAVAGTALLGIGVIRPLKDVKSRMTFGARDSDIKALLRSNNELLKRIEVIQSQQLANLGTLTITNTLLHRASKAQTEQLTRTILSDPKHRDPKKLSHYEFKVSSQNGEDGIIAEIFRRIGTKNRFVVEFGAASGEENNSALLVRQGWGGLWMDANTNLVNTARKTFRPQVEAGKLTVLETFITAENIEDLFARGKVPQEFDLLSIDIDRNDYHVWEKITHYNPRVVIVEYNGGIPPAMSWVTPYDPKAFGFVAFGNGNGASLKALEELATQKGYSLVGCDLSGVNAFFVRNDLLGDHFAAPYTAENHYEPFRFHYITR